MGEAYQPKARDALGRRSLSSRERVFYRLIAPFELEVPINEGFFPIEPQGRAPHRKTQLFIQWLLGHAKEDNGARGL